MIGTFSAIDTAFLLGLCYCGIALGLVVSLRFLNFPDLTIEGSIPLGGAVAGLTLLHTNSIPLALSAAVLSGAAAGCFTAFLHVFLRVGKLLSGILVLAALYTVCLRILGGSNLSLLNTGGIWAKFDSFDRGISQSIGASVDPWKIGGLLVLTAVVASALICFFNARPGIAIRAIGDNEAILPGMGRDSRPYKFIGLAFANGLGALAGSLVAFNQGFADVGMGQGGLVLGLAGLILGEQTLGRILGRRLVVIALVLGGVSGSILYQAALLLAFRFGIQASDVKLVTAVIVLAAIVSTGGGSVFYRGRTF